MGHPPSLRVIQVLVRFLAHANGIRKDLGSCFRKILPAEKDLHGVDILFVLSCIRCAVLGRRKHVPSGKQVTSATGYPALRYLPHRLYGPWYISLRCIAKALAAL